MLIMNESMSLARYLHYKLHHIIIKLMKSLYYVIQTLLHSRGANLIKIISITLGITVSILVFARQSFELNYDKCYEDYERLFLIKNTYIMNDRVTSSHITYGPVAGLIAEAFPEEVESVTVTQQWFGSRGWYRDDNRFSCTTITGDSCFFSTLGIRLLAGNPMELNNPDVVFISRSFAREAFADEDPIGQTLTGNRKLPMTVKGIYEDFPENSSLYGTRAVMSLASSFKYGWGYWGLDGGDGYMSFVRLRRAEDVDMINTRLVDLVKRFTGDSEDLKLSIELTPVKDYRKENNPNTMRTVLILITLGAAILFIVTLNYVLISISSISRRAKSIGVHKCSGADESKIFGMFILETGIILLVSLGCMALLLLNFREPVEDLLDVSLEGLFGWDNIWASLCVVAFLFVVGGVLPGQMFSRIPVTQVFRRYTEGKKSWKRPLLFVQFCGVAFIFGLLGVVLSQTHHVTTRDRGQNTKNVAVTHATLPNGDNARNTLLNLPYVERVASGSDILLGGLSGEFVTTDAGKGYSMRWLEVDKDYVPLLELKLKEGRNLAKPEEVLVNEKFLELMHWEDSPIGRRVQKQNEIFYGTIVGVLKDFPTGNPAYVATQPLFMTFKPNFNDALMVCLKEPFDENLKKLNADIKEIFPQEDLLFKSYQEMIDVQKRSVTNFRNATVLAAITILFITLMGLIGYTNDEVQRRSKEIAIRKVNGADATAVLGLLAKDVLWTSVPAVIIGTVGAWYVGGVWREQFVETSAFLSIYYILIGIGVMAIILGCVIWKSWRIANENPVYSIKSE